MIVHNILRVLVVENKILDYQYFMDEAEEWEALELIDISPYAYKNEWNMTRERMWLEANKFAKKKIEREDIYKFIWDEKAEEKHNTEISNEDIQRLREKAKTFNIKNMVME